MPPTTWFGYEQTQAEADENGPLVYTWCYITLMNAKGETPEECINNFVTENQPFNFEPLSCYGFCAEGICKALVYYSMRAEDTTDAGLFVECRFRCPLEEYPPGPIKWNTVFFPDEEKTLTQYVLYAMSSIHVAARGSGRPIVGEAPDILEMSYEDETAIELVKEFEKKRQGVPPGLRREMLDRERPVTNMSDLYRIWREMSKQSTASMQNREENRDEIEKKNLCFEELSDEYLTRLRRLGEPDSEAELVYTWCHVRVYQPKEKTAEEFITEFTKSHQPLNFTPISYYGFHCPELCEFLMLYSIRANSIAEAGQFMEFRFEYPDGREPTNDDPSPPSVHVPGLGGIFSKPPATFVQEYIGEIDRSRKVHNCENTFGERPDYPLTETDFKDLGPILKDFEGKMIKARTQEQ